MSKLVHKVEAVASKIVHPKSSSTSKPAGIDTTGPEIGDIGPPKDGQRTPADEAIFFFESASTGEAQPVQVWELQLEEDGAPSKDKAVRVRWPPKYLNDLYGAPLVHSPPPSLYSLRPASVY